MPRCGILASPICVLHSGLEYGQPLHNRRVGTRLDRKNTLGPQYIRERTNVESFHVQINVKNSVLATRSPKHCELRYRQHTTPENILLSNTTHPDAVTLLPPTHDSRNQISFKGEPPKLYDLVPTNGRLPKSIFSPRRSTKTPSTNTRVPQTIFSPKRGIKSL